MAFFLLGLFVLVAFIFFARWFVQAEPKDIIYVLKWVLGILAVALAALFIFSGRWGWLFYLLPALLPWIMRARTAARMAKNFNRMASGGGASSPSTVETAYLRMTLDPSSGDINGTILQGAYEGQGLSELDRHDLLILFNECVANDVESARLVATYLDRVFPDWREDAAHSDEDTQSSSETATGPMSRDEAFRVLGLEPGATDAEIKKAYHALIANLHPDKGGSDYLASKINEARDILLK